MIEESLVTDKRNDFKMAQCLRANEMRNLSRYTLRRYAAGLGVERAYSMSKRQLIDVIVKSEP